MKKDILVGVAWAGVMLALALAAVYARKQGYIESETVQRIVAMNGLMVAYYGNLMPKKVVPSAHARQVNRFSGWMMVLTGLLYAGFWAFAPIQMAMIFGTGALAAGVIVTLVYCLGLRGGSAGA